MRTTIRLDDALLHRAKALAASSGRSLNDFIADAVRAALARRPAQAGAVELPSFRGKGLQPGVDLDDSAALLDLMDLPGQTAYPEAGSAAHRRANKVAEKTKRRGA